MFYEFRDYLHVVQLGHLSDSLDTWKLKIKYNWICLICAVCTEVAFVSKM